MEMGSIFAPKYGNLFVGFFEHCYIFNSDPFLPCVLKWYRQIEDIFYIVIWVINTANEFVFGLCSYVDNFKFTLEVNVPLDMWVRKIKVGYITTLLQKILIATLFCLLLDFILPF